MEKDIGRIPKGMDTEIVVRIDDFGGRPGLTIREFVKSERYTGFTKAGTRIPADKFKDFKHMINSIDESDLQSAASAATQSKLESPKEKSEKKNGKKKAGDEEEAEEVPEESEEEIEDTEF
ncbi:MAG: hypothetical protein Q8Q31_02735 [Nanoarchaeota archaeon]|nr:hypothetical protein [Nanoarchaeota archaeon]